MQVLESKAIPRPVDFEITLRMTAREIDVLRSHLEGFSGETVNYLRDALISLRNLSQ